MTSKIMASYQLYQALKDEGFVLPDECGDVTLTMPVDGILQLHYHINLTDVTLAQVGRALARIAEGRVSPSDNDRLMDELKRRVPK